MYALTSADPHDISAQIDLIGMPWLMIREDPSAAPIGGSASVLAKLRDLLLRAGRRNACKHSRPEPGATAAPLKLVRRQHA
jgi:hypothetical protein